jgi:hypothetical protein
MASYDIDIYANDRTGRTLSNIERQLGEINSRGRAVVGTLAGLATGTVARGIINQYRAYERYNTVLRTYLGSQERANSELDRLQRLANSLPQDLDDITQAFTIFTRTGVDTSSKALTAFSNIATANGKSLTQLGEAVADALTGEFERLKEFGIKVSKENGKFVADIGNGQSIIASSSADLVRQLQALGEAGGKFGSAAANNADSLNQSISNLQGALFTTSVTIGQNLAPALKQAADLTADWLNSHQELVASLSGKLGSALIDSIHLIGNGLDIISKNMEVIRASLIAFLGVKILGDFQQIVQRVTRDTKSLSQVGEAFTVSARGMGVATADLGVKAAATQSMWVKLGKLFKDFVREIPIIGGALSSLGGILARLGPMLLAPWLGIPVAIGTAVASGLYYFRDAMIDLGSTSASVGEIVAASWWGLTELFKGAAQWMIDSFNYAFDTIAGGLGTVYNYFAERFSGVLSTVKDIVNKMIGVVWGFFQMIWNNLRNVPAFFAQAFSSALQVIGAFASRAGAQIGEIWDYITSFGEDAIQNRFEGLGGVISAEIANIGATVEPIDWNTVIGTDYIGSAADIVTETVGTMVTTIGGTVKDATANLVENYRTHVAESQAAAAATAYYDDAILRMSRTQEVATATTDSLTNATTNAGKAALTAAQEIAKGLAEEQARYNNLNAALNDTSAIQALSKAYGVSADLIARKLREARNSITDFYQENVTITGIIGDTWNEMSQGMARGIAEGIMEGKGAFNSFADFLKDFSKRVLTQILEKMLIQPMINQMTNLFSGGGAPVPTLGAQLGMGGGGGLLGGLFGGGGGGLFGGIGNFFSGLWGGISNFFGGLFGGFFANGGYLPAGKVGIAGEAGPELISGPANITPLNNDMGGALTVNFNIQAIDSQSGTEFILQHKREIEGVIQNAYNRRGKEGIY